ncbi:hypothetical protein BOTBODRAFT_483871 [Botryobasidium botryosum FD-172 SS1]|uniref:Zn(2)-C6 fungal-type domain-containing protein n=1 Tax=Botryobasidium botryosum (strain FD-172 SS1) TaxID=930990 RepID=A0A067MU06_BOTB1|nr:hypothetical protein BOTBODRAFT_483871 [Botryobasidium botryosum FD-172 SS1]
MTADKSGDHASKRSARRGALSCAECRRLKLRCDRQFPCQSCRKRGCAAICPDGALTTGKGNRFILANTEELHNKISELQDRIISLEEALSSLQATVSNEPHPLLREDLLRIKASITATTAAPEASTSTGESKAGVSVKLPKLVAKPPTGNDSAEEEGPEVLSAFGTLKIDDQGKSRYFGSLAGAQLLLGSDESDDEAPCDPRAPPPALRPMENLLPNEVAKLAHTYPFAMNPCDYEGTRRQLEGLLPPAAKAWSITQKYYEYSTWQFNCVPRQWFTDRVLVPLYEPQRNADQAPEHQLALVYMVFALGTLIDLDLPPFHPDAEHYHQLARAALALDSQGTSIMAVQALILMAYFNQLTDKKNGPGLSWMVMGIAVKMGTGIGLHRDPKRWKMDPEQTDLRRMVFWELACFDAWQAQGFGRPPMITFEHVDTALPIDWEERVNAAGQVESSFYRLKYTYTELLLSTLNTAFGAQRPTYETILRLDRRIRDFHVPDHMRVPGLQEMDHVVPNDTEPPTLHLTMQRHLLFFVKEITLLYLHRSFFARALTEQPGDPFKSRYAASVLACYRSSSGVLAGIRNAYQLHPGLVPRFYMFWTHAFSSAIVLAAIVTRSPGCNLAYRALGELDAAYTMFKAASELQGSRATKALCFTKYASEPTITTPSIARAAWSSPLMYTRSQARRRKRIRRCWGTRLALSPHGRPR